jgi:hypothetical protein
LMGLWRDSESGHVASKRFIPAEHIMTQAPQVPCRTGTPMAGNWSACFDLTSNRVRLQ